MAKQRVIFISSLLVICCNYSVIAAEADTQMQAGTETDLSIRATDSTNSTTESTNTTETDTIEQTEDNQHANIDLASEAIQYVCSLQDLTRRVEVDYMETDTVVPCEVSYYKDVETPGIKQTLWTAQNSVGYCESQAHSFVNKLVGLGWSCENQ